MEAILDASFWNAAFGPRVEAYLPRLFRVVAPPLVRSEVLTDSIRGRGNFPNAETFRLWEFASLLVVAGPTTPWSSALGPERFQNKGEQGVIALAYERGAIALINEVAAINFAKQTGLPVLDVPGWIVLLAHNKLIPMGAAWSGLKRLEEMGRVSPALTGAARSALEALAKGGWQ